MARRYFAALDGLRRRMATGPVARLMTPDCPCRSQVRAIRAAIRRGDRYTDRVRVVSLAAHLDRTDLADIFVSLDVSRGGLVDAMGRRLLPPTTLRNVHRQLMIERIGGHWLIRQVLAV